MSWLSWDWNTAGIIAGLGVITLFTRGFFILPERDRPMPPWLQQGLRYAPLAALVAVVAPEVVMSQGQLIGTWKDARVFAAAAGAAWYFWRHGILGTIVVGSAVMLVLRLGLGW
jgi:branched-subunit amino acid transport protein